MICVEPVRRLTRVERQRVGRRASRARRRYSRTPGTFERCLFHPSFPVDARHNAKIFREKLAEWATRKLS